MKKIFLIPLLIIFGWTYTSAQNGFVGFQPILEFEDSPGNPLREYGKTFGGVDVTGEISGDVYVEKEFVPGTIMVEGTDKQLDILLRYNVVADAVEVKIKGKDSIYVLPKLNTLIYKTPEYTYKYNSLRTRDGEDVSGFLIHYFDGEQTSFLSKPVIHLRKEALPSSGYGSAKPAHYSIKYKYYLSKNNGSLKEVRLREKDFRKEFSEEKEMNKYFSENKVKGVKGVVEMLNFYEEIQEGS